VPELPYSPEVQKLFHDFIPGTSVPTHQKLSGQILTRKVGKMEGSVKEATKGAFATIQSDGWKDISKKHLVGLVMCAARLQAVGQAKPGPIRPSQAGPKSRPDHGFGLA
jgi:hypothetical protein